MTENEESIDRLRECIARHTVALEETLQFMRFSMPIIAGLLGLILYKVW